MEDPSQKSITLNYLEHLEACKNSRVGLQLYPDKGELLKFKKPESLHPQPMIMYLDFETSNQSLSQVIFPLFSFNLIFIHHFFSCVTAALSCIRLREVSFERTSWQRA